MSHTSHLPKAACPPFTTKRPSTPLSLLTTSWKMLNQEQLVQETWTCKDPLCRKPHHQNPTGYPSTPSTFVPQDTRSYHRESSDSGFTVTLSLHPYTEANPHHQEAPD